MALQARALDALSSTGRALPALQIGLAAGRKHAGWCTRQRRKPWICCSSGQEPNLEQQPKAPATPPEPATNGTPASPPTLLGEDQSLRLPKEVIERLKTTVFGFDTFWVTSVENYQEDGVIFQGNVRGRDPAISYSKMKERLKAQLGDRYSLFLLQDKDDKPTVIVLPEGAGAERISRGQEVWLALLFFLGTLVTTLNAAGAPILDYLGAPGQVQISQQDFVDAIPYAAGTFALLFAHEVGHWRAAKKHGTDTYLPFLVPAGFGFLGSFGAITRLRGFLPDRAALLEFATAGPLYGSAVSFGLLLLGAALSAAGVVDIGVDSPSFAESLLVAVTAQAFLGSSLAEPIVQVNSLMLAGWAGLILNALNCIPAGETDGGRIATAVWGRRTGSAFNIWSLGGLALASLGSALAFYTLILILVLQRGPVLPCNNEMTEPKDEAAIWRGLGLLALPFLVLLPYPVELIVAVRDTLSSSYF